MTTYFFKNGQVGSGPGQICNKLALLPIKSDGNMGNMQGVTKRCRLS